MSGVILILRTIKLQILQSRLLSPKLWRNIMTLEKKIIEKLQQSSHMEVLKAMGYTRVEKYLGRIELFIKINDIYLWLKDDSYDYLYNSEGFMRKLISVLKLSSPDTDEQITRHMRMRVQVNEMCEPCIMIDSEFERKSKSMHDLYKARHKKRIMIRKESLVFLNLTECLDMVELMVKEHHAQTQGDLGILGKVRFYYFRNSDGNIYGFDQYGERL